MFLKSFFLLLICYFSIPLSWAEEFTVVIKGAAPAYVNSEITVSTVDDYITDRETVVARSTVGTDSLFQLQFTIDKTQRVVLRSENNRAWMYVQANGEYDVYLPDRDPYLPPVKSGNLVELTFFNLEPSDINYKILAFQRWNDDSMSLFYRLKDKEPKVFAAKLDTFKTYVEKAYAEEEDIFFLTYVRFSIAELDEIQFAGSRNRYEKFDFYIAPSPVFYNNDAYMNYVLKYYKNLVPRLSNRTNVAFYDAVIKSSPTMLMHALGTEYSLKNLRIREMVMIQALSEVFYSDDFPQTNIMTILDSLSNKSLFKEHETIAENVIFRLTDLVPGGKAPNFMLSGSESIKTKYDFEGKHLYLHFFDPNSSENMKEIDLIEKLQADYGEHVQIVSIAVSNNEFIPERLKEIDWELYSVSPEDEILDKFKVLSYPHYVMIDAAGNIIGAPALAPTPNSKYETIDKTMFYIKKYREENR